ncbi:nucleoside deaminase [Cryobacterium sp. PH31-O1]|uniref:nucleoside deaminase n=1 Tax=Cryobacterium sp. PH31-O1 TaxID=3046306 RepID=UPI0024BBB4CE|nr:nucleoside deaminase [Cryobacterium sp. PH31-O1]MDJ0339018.1 nucleoside deaminase [Cryobacterium sp. PH31-O1]
MTDPSTVSSTDETHLRHAIDVARAAREVGNHPFGAILVSGEDIIIEGQNTVVTLGDPTGHAETNLVRIAATLLARDALQSSTLYTSAEPCAMCSGAIYWAGIGRVVYALPGEELAAMVPSQDGAATLNLPCREVFARGSNTITVAGPALLAEAAEVHAGFWDARR